MIHACLAIANTETPAPTPATASESTLDECSPSRPTNQLLDIQPHVGADHAAIPPTSA